MNGHILLAASLNPIKSSYNRQEEEESPLKSCLHRANSKQTLRLCTSLHQTQYGTSVRVPRYVDTQDRLGSQRERVPLIIFSSSS